ncbi:hypothetical protein SteCoe_8974 [Stentor coeruleus]|uniref:C2H2-type domain-containing protein n=1 Tax=Stentor coeruleus TaxID=5963 RepID=A0A1R2CJ36_9CILI|nr:hypothetical protein SteCoe_8974 [Stentor coeruleus]
MPKKSLHCEYEGCTRSYCSSFNLKRHIESSHYGLRKFKCPLCSKLLSSKQNLIDHQNIHSGAKPYKCEILSCGMVFRQLSQYYLHKQLHIEVSNHIVHNYNTFDSDLKLLMLKISEECCNSSYTIPTIPYTIEDIKLPIINIGDSFELKLPLMPILKSLN